MKNTAAEKPIFKKIFRKRFAVIMTVAVVLCIAAYALASYFFKNYVKEKARQHTNALADSIETVAEQYYEYVSGNMSAKQYQRFLAKVDYILSTRNPYNPTYNTMIGGNDMDFAVRVFCGNELVADSTDKIYIEFAPILTGDEYYTCHPEVNSKVIQDIAEFRKEYGKKDTATGLRIDKAYIGGRYFAPCITYCVTEFDSKTGTETDKDIKTVEYYPESTEGMELVEVKEESMFFHSEVEETDRCERVMNTVTERLLKGKDAYISNANTGETVTVRDIDYKYLDKITSSDNWSGKDGLCFWETSISPIKRENALSFHVVLGAENSLMHYFPGIVILSVLGVLIAAFIIAYSSSKISYAGRKAQYEIFAARQETTRAMAHDLKTPMTSISGYAEMLQGNVKPEKQEHYLEMIMQNVGQMNTIVGDILELSKAEADSEALNIEPIDIAALCSEIAESMSGAFENAGLTCRINAVMSPVIRADRRLLVQAVTNLLHNAAVYSKQGTDVTVTVSQWELSVRNTPETMPNKSPEELVKPFVKGSDFRGSNSGSGVGLSIVKHNLERMGFKFEIQLGADTFTSKCLFNRTN